MKTDYTLLKALQQKDEKAIRYVYWDYFASVRHYIELHGGSAQDAEDIFQDALLLLLSKVAASEFVLSSSIKTFHFGICKRMWLNELGKRKKALYDPLTEGHVEVKEEEEVLAREADWDSMEVVMKQITQFCSKFLKDLFVDGQLPTSYKNAHTLHNQKYKCLLQARRAAQKIKAMHG